ncbi:SDR family oxidoreductase [Saccharopolyspora sp. CA-218241]|uniref:SDR family oxidoreductase n=1 Tax=Saccharopolyspora sp. CA-218241 TaxID=3240027 RepID=UPI003D97FDAE
MITGGSAGVGRAIVREFARSGYDVAVLARGRAGLDGAVEEVRRAGRRALAVPTDVADEDAVERAAEIVEGELGEIAVWVNTAFVGALAFFWDTASAEYRRITEVTYYGQVHGCRVALQRMRPRDRGVIINVGSAMAYRSIPLQAAYCGAKHAVKGFTESVVAELAHERSGVRLCTIQLPALNTPQFSWNLNRMPGNPMPLPPIFAPEVAARAVRFLAEHPRRNMWVGISTVYTVLGERLAPKLLDRYLARSGVPSQQTSQRTPRSGPNVFVCADETVDAGAEGPFTDRQHRRDPQSWLSMHRRVLLTGLGCAAVAGAVSARVRRGR